MSSHTHFVKLTLEVGNLSDSESHQEIVLTQRTESAEQNTLLQQSLVKAINDMFVAMGNEAIAAKSGKAKGKSGVIR